MVVAFLRPRECLRRIGGSRRSRVDGIGFRFRALLRFKANFGFAACFLEFLELGQAAGESALVRGLVADKKRELIGIEALRAIGVKAEFLHQESASTQPVVLGHTVDENRLGGRAGLIFGAEFREELVESRGIFPCSDDKVGSGESVGEAVAEEVGFTGFGFGTGRMLGVGAISGHPRG